MYHNNKYKKRRHFNNNAQKEPVVNQASPPEREVSIIRGDVFSLREKLGKSIFLRLDQEVLKPQEITSYVKLIDCFLGLVKTEISIKGNTKTPEMPKAITFEDNNLLKMYKKDDNKGL